MNNILSLNEKNETANMNRNLLTRHYKLKLMNDFMYIKYRNLKMKQSEIANELNLSSFSVQRYRNDIYICFHHTELAQIKSKNGQKWLNSMISVTSKDLK